MAEEGDRVDFESSCKGIGFEAANVEMVLCSHMSAVSDVNALVE